ncbi:Alpha/Beta hydrolase protein [Phycomyces nitens]|nr:Alpha/Beta hydrolase protein [Phycomyces nitens]
MPPDPLFTSLGAASSTDHLITVDQPTPAQMESAARPIDPTFTSSPRLRNNFSCQPNDTTCHTTWTGSNKPKRPLRRIKRSPIERIEIMSRTALSLVISCPVLLVLLIISLYKTIHRQYFIESTRNEPQDEPKEDITSDEAYYSSRWGYDCTAHKVVTKDGYILSMYRITKKGVNPTDKPPVLIVHGLFQCSGAFVLNEEKSLAFALVDQGYDVWLGNNRSTGGLDHISLSYKDPEYWNWGLKELGVYDCVAMVNHVLESTGQPKVGYIGHSQGNAQAFIALSLQPEMADCLSCFIALAPAVYSGDLVRSYPLKYLVDLEDQAFRTLFGNACFLPIMNLSQKLCNPSLFCFLAYSMFSYLFAWWDSHWLTRRKPKYFQFTPRPVSSKLILDWMHGWGKRGLLLHVPDSPPQLLPGLTKKIRLAIFYGTADYLVDGEKLVRTLEAQDKQSRPTLFPMLDLVHVERIEGYEHMDTIWGHDNHTTTYPGIFNMLATAEWNC